MASWERGSALFLFFLSLSFLAAFVSILIQLPGLYGESGIEPIDLFVFRISQHFELSSLDANFDGNVSKLLADFSNFPSLIAFAPLFGLTPFDAARHLCLIGGVVSLCHVLFMKPSVLSSLVVVIIYLGIFKVGQTFLSFQWDILLIEVGVIGVLMSDWMPFKLGGVMKGMVRVCKKDEERGTARKSVVAGPSVWLLRWCFFKFMLMSGLVKLQAKCPTWEGLTALHYHYATQCLPTAEAWYAHHLPSIGHKAGVMATLLIEIPWAVLLLAPGKAIRMFGFVTQAVLQVLIIITGNYNFFNFLTIALCFCLLDDDQLSWRCARRRDDERKGEEESTTVNALPQNDDMDGREMNGKSKSRNTQTKEKEWDKTEQKRNATAISVSRTLLILVEYGVLAAAVAIPTITMFKFSRNEAVCARKEVNVPPYLPHFFSTSLYLRELFIDGCLDVELVMSSSDIDKYMTDIFPYVCIYAFAVMIWRMCDIGDLFKRGCSLSTLLLLALTVVRYLAIFAVFIISIAPLSTVIEVNEGFAGAKHVLNMSNYLHTATQPFHLASGYGLFRRMTGVGSGGEVARPEIDILAKFDTKEEWVPVPFLFKPGSVTAQPRRNIPHQPRLDWQMWFAALGSYQNNPWLLSFLDRLGDGEESVIDLIDKEKYLKLSGGRKPMLLRADLYHYDFAPPFTPSSTSASTSSSNKKQKDEANKKWWRRKRVGDYLPVINCRSDMLKRPLQQVGLRNEKAARKVKAVASAWQKYWQEYPYLTQACAYASEVSAMLEAFVWKAVAPLKWTG